MHKLTTLSKMVGAIFVIFTCLGATSPTVIANLLRNPTDPVGGNPHGKVTVVEFFDYHCGYCTQLEPIIHTLLKNNKNVRFVYKEYPVLSPDSIEIAYIALAANQQDKYQMLHSALLSGRYSLSLENIYTLAQSLGINVNKLKTDAASSQVEQQIKMNVIVGNELNIPGTPAFFIAKTKAVSADDVMAIMGATSLNELQSAVTEAARD